MHADSKGKVAVDDIRLDWTNLCTKCHGNIISRFHLIAHYQSISHIYLPQQNLSRLVNASTKMGGYQKSYRAHYVSGDEFFTGNYIPF